jgi:hypothetical protein
MFEHLPPHAGAHPIGIVAAGGPRGLAAPPGPAAAASSCRLETRGESLIAQARALARG